MQKLDSTIQGYEQLANAIIIRAVKDYKSGSERTKAECRKFFYSDWFKSLTNVHPDYIMKVCEDPSIKTGQIRSE